MSFLQEFNDSIYEPWHVEYVAYESIYNGLHKVCNHGNWTSKDEKDFELAIRLEIGKVDLFIKRKRREIESKLAYCERLLYQGKLDEVRRASIDDTLTDVLADINELNHFTRINFKALQDLVKEHDTLTNTTMQQVLVEISRLRPLDNQRFDDILVKVSSLLDICRDRLGSSQETPSESHEDQNQLISARYWVHQDNITEVKALLLFNLPMYVNNPAQEFEQTEHSTSAIYFDNDQFSEYSSRLQRDDEAEIIDFRWYGDIELSKTVFIEKRTFVKTDQGGRSVIDKIIMDQDRVYDFISQRYTAKEYVEDLKQHNDDQEYVDNCYTIAKSIQKSISDKHLEPKLRIYFNQLRFESPQDKTLSVTLDNNIAFVREDGVRRGQAEWRRKDVNINYPFSLLNQDVCLFPYAILETRVKGDNIPLWLSRLVNSNLVYEVPRFSAYLQGVAHFWSPQLPLLPWWIADLDQDIRKPQQKVKDTKELFGLTRSKSFKTLIDGQYRMGYLESQLGRKDSRHSVKGISTINSLDRRKSNRKNTDNNLSVSDYSDGKSSEYLEKHVEYASLNGSSSLHRTSTSNSKSSRAKLRARYSTSDTNNDKTTFLEAYYDGRNPQSQAYMLQDVNTIKQTDELKQTAVIEMGEEKKKKKKKQKPPGHTMEPKIFFANERTFIHWLQFAMIVLTAALTLLNFGDTFSTISGITFFCVSFAVAMYAFLRYRYRAYQISTRPHIRYDDIYGPAGLCFLIVGAMILNFVLRIQHPSKSDTYLGINNGTDQQNNTSPI